MPRLEIITGPMYAGKSEEMIRRLHVAGYAEKTIVVFKPKKDNRSHREVSSRKKKAKEDKKFEKSSCFPAHEIETIEEAAALLNQYTPDILALDEGQLFDPKFVEFITSILTTPRYRNLSIIISGLDMTSEGQPFAPMPQFMALAHEVLKLRAVCFKCRAWPPSAEMTYFKKGKKEDVVYIDDGNSYEARCRECWLAADNS